MNPELKEASRELGDAYDDYFDLSDALRQDGERILNDPNADGSWRRNMVRVTWPMIEAYASTLRKFCNVFRKYCEMEISKKHLKLLEDESSLGSADRIKESLKIGCRIHELDESIDFGDQRWQYVKLAIVVRDRITHPNSSKDLTISDKEWGQVHTGLLWLLQNFTRFFEQVNKKYGTDA